MAAEGAMKERLADTARGTPMEWLPPSTRETVGLDMEAMSSAMASPASTSPPPLFSRINSPSIWSLSSTVARRGRTCSYFVLLLVGGRSWCPSICPTMVNT